MDLNSESVRSELRRGGLTTLLVVFSTWIPAGVGGQEVPDLAVESGDRVRFVAPPRFPDRVTGEVTVLEQGLLLVDRKSSNGGPVEVRVIELSSLEVSVDRKRQTVLGLGIGAGVGLALGGLLAWAYCDGPDNLCELEDVALLTATVAVPFSALGALLGNFTYKDVWQEVQVQ